LVQEFANLGFATLDEAFLDMPSYENLHPQSVLMEMNWICAWFQRILQEASRSDGKRVVIVDRSPLSAVFYTRNGQGKLLLPIIAAQIKELREVGIEVFTVHVKCATDVLWNRVQRRLSLEPERALYKEDSKEWLLEVQTFYNNFNQWDFTVDNSVDDRKLIKNVMRDIIDSVSTKSPKMCDARRMFLESNAPCKRIYLDDPAAVIV
jgi:thymidylate kinase